MGGPTGRMWSLRELEALREHYPDHGAKWAGWAEVLPGRTEGAIGLKASRLGIDCRRGAWLENMSRGIGEAGEMRERWSVAEDLAVMRAVRQAQIDTGRSGRAIVARARLLMERHEKGDI